MSSKIKQILKIILILFILQIIRIILRKTILLVIPTTNLTLILINSLIFIIYTYLLIKYCKKKKIDLRILKVSNKNSYLVLTIILLILLIINFVVVPFNIENIFSILYSVFIISIFEELLFRGYVWNKIDKMFNNGIITYLIVTVLFSIWHIGYIDSLIMNAKINNMNFNMNIVLWKVVIGFIYGALTGLVRYETKNTYSSIFVHSLMNMFSR